MRKKTRLLLIIILSVLYWPITAKTFFFDQISLDQGLSQSTVRVIYRDYMGLLWIGTKQGLNRYDGMQVRTYFSDSKNEKSLPNDNIFFITEDSHKNLWIGTEGTLCRYDRQHDSFVREKINGKEVTLRNMLVKGDTLISASANALFIHNTTENTWKTYSFHGAETNLLPASKIEHWTNGKILIGSRWKGVFECDLRTGLLRRLPYYSGHNILDIYRDPQNRLWISEFGKGVFGFDDKGRMIFNSSKVPNNIKTDQVMDMIWHNNMLWMMTDGNGVLLFSPKNNHYEKITHDPNNPFSLQVNSFLSVYTDRYNNIWLGSIRGGLIGVRNVNIQSYQNAPLNTESGLSENTVLSFYEDEEGMIWIGTDGEGLNRYNPVTQKFTHFPGTYGKKISSLTSYLPGKLLIGLYKEGLEIFDIKSGTLTPLPIQNSPENNFLKNGQIGFSVQNARNGLIYIAGEKVFTYNPINQSIKEAKTKFDSEGVIRFYCPDHSPNTLLLYSGLSVELFDKKTNHLLKSIKQSQGIINAVEIDRSGLLWLGMSTGLYSVNMHTRKMTRVKGNLINSVSTLVLDKNESMWIGSGLNLYSYNLRDKELIRYHRADGVFPNEYLPKSRLCSRSGDIYLGGVSGFCRIDKEIRFNNADRPEFRLLEIFLDGSLINGENINNQPQEIHIPWNNTSLSINIFVNTKDLNNTKRTRYTLSGLSNAYHELDKQSATFQSLPPGKYTLQVQTELKNEEWSQSVSLLKIYVSTPWWQTWWFYTFVLIVIAVSLMRFRRNAIRNATKNMELEMQRRDKEMSEQKVRFLINISHELRTPLTLIYSPLRRILTEGKASEELQPTLTLMYKHVRNMKNMIDMVLDVRKMEISSEKLKVAPYDTNTWIKETTDDFRLELEARKIDLTTELDSNVGLIYFDKEKCDKVLSNLLMNAIKFSEGNSNITVRSENLGDFIRISVEDEGQGVNPKDREQLFTRFYQGEHQKGGTGIGLSYAKIQVEKHGGRIGYKPGIRKGSIFWFELPLGLQENIVSETNSIIAPNKPDVNTGESSTQYEELSKLTILIVEDEPDLLNYIKDSLSTVFNKVLTATNGEKALNIIHNYSPDFVVSDVMMPVMNGFELCRNIKTDINISHIPVILLTALGDDSSMLAGYKVGADTYLSKPFGVDMLLTVITNLLRNREEIKKRYSKQDSSLTLNDISFSNADEKFLNKLISLIEARIDDTQLNIDQLAVEMAMSRTSFYKKIKVVTDMSANAFLNDYKIKKSCVLLRTTESPVQEIAMDLGFINQRYFSTVFKQITGQTPSQYREKQQKEDGANK